MKALGSLKPFKVIDVISTGAESQTVNRPKDHPNIYVQLIEIAANRVPQKFEAFMWENPTIKIKLLEDEGFAIVYLDGKAKAGAYCKVFNKTAS